MDWKTLWNKLTRQKDEGMHLSWIPSDCNEMQQNEENDCLRFENEMKNTVQYIIVNFIWAEW